MANEPLALAIRPPDAPNEDEFLTLCAALSASARGRAFLAEYARRNRHADTEALLVAIGRIEARLQRRRLRRAAPARRSAHAADRHPARPPGDRCRRPGRAGGEADASCSTCSSAASTPWPSAGEAARTIRRAGRSHLAVVPPPDEPELPIPSPASAPAPAIALVPECRIDAGARARRKRCRLPPPVVAETVVAAAARSARRHHGAERGRAAGAVYVAAISFAQTNPHRHCRRRGRRPPPCP